MKYASLHEDVRVFKGELVHKLAMKRSAATATPPSTSTRCTAAKSATASANCCGTDAGKTVLA